MTIVHLSRKVGRGKRNLDNAARRSASRKRPVVVEPLPATIGV
jgi:hypothetical protein